MAKKPLGKDKFGIQIFAAIIAQSAMMAVWLSKATMPIAPNKDLM